MWPIVTDQVVWSDGRIVTQVSPAKTPEAIEMPFGLRTWECTEALRDVAMATNFGTQFGITGFLAFDGLYDS